VAEKADPPHISPLPTSEWSRDVIGAFAAMKPPPGSTYEARRNKRESGGKRVANAFSVFAHHPDLTKAFLGFNRHLLYENTLDERILELIILRISFLRNSVYEWAQHVPVALDVGVTEEEVDRVAVGPDATGWGTLDSAVLRAVDELRNDSVISGETWSVLTEAYDTQQVLDLLFTVGAYDTLAVAFNCFGLELDPELQGATFPDVPNEND
jgi:alkylhydroperoxidase family enzyme